MKCLRSGYCCIRLCVIIVDDPDKGIREDNLIYKPGGVRCKHLSGNRPGEHSCAIYDRPWYSKTPCHAFTQIEKSNSDCRLGRFTLDKGLKV